MSRIRQEQDSCQCGRFKSEVEMNKPCDQILHYWPVLPLFLNTESKSVDQEDVADDVGYNYNWSPLSRFLQASNLSSLVLNKIRICSMRLKLERFDDNHDDKFNVHHNDEK